MQPLPFSMYGKGPVNQQYTVMKPALYGGTVSAPIKGVGDNFVPFPKMPPSRRRVNCLAIAQCILLPWGLFAGALWLVSYWVHSTHPHECNFLVLCGLTVCMMVVVHAYIQKRKNEKEQQALEGAPPDPQAPNWIIFLTVSCTLAWCLGIILGEVNFALFMEPYYNVHDMMAVSNVDPRSSSGQEYMDASVLTFSNDTHVDQGKSLSFKDGTLYCVAPITLGTVPLARYDFWAAGTNCCNPYGGAFWCGDAILSHTALTGLRIVDDEQVAYYRRGVQQASAEYGIQAGHPIFVTWSEDPHTLQGELSLGHPLRLKEQADRLFLWALVLYLFCQTVAVLWMLSHYATFPGIEDII